MNIFNRRGRKLRKRSGHKRRRKLHINDLTSRLENCLHVYRIAGNFRAVQNFAFFVGGCRPAKIKTAKSFCNAHAHGQV